MTSRLTLSMVLALVSLLQGASAQVTLDIPNPTVEKGTVAYANIIGTPGQTTILLVDFVEGTTLVPGIGTFEVAFSPLVQILNLGPMPASGELNLSGSIGCRDQLVGAFIYMQAVQVEGSTYHLSNGDQFDIVDGDCFINCEGGIAKLGLETVLSPVSDGAGTLDIVVRKNDAGGDLQADLSIALDLDRPFALPLSNGDTSIVVTVLELDNGDLTVRFCMDAAAAGLAGGMMGGGAPKLDANTYFSVSFGGATNEEEIHTSCSQPIDLGFTFGEFTITQLLDTVN